MKYFNIRDIGKNQKIEVTAVSKLTNNKGSIVGRVVRVLPHKLILDYDGEWVDCNMLLEFCPENVKEVNYPKISLEA